MPKTIQPRISVLILTYNQQDLIGRAINSVLCQSDYLYEIVVSDDCSTDKNWEVILHYQQKYPSLIKAFRNEKNLGIYGNIESLMSKCSGDLYVELSGDDTINNGFFAKVVNFIYQKGIDFKNYKFCIYFDFVVQYPSGYKIIISNKLIKNPNLSPISLKIRGLIYTRGTICSSNLIHLHKKIPKNIGSFCDELMDIQKPMLADKNYYIPFIASTYYSHIGISHNKNPNSYNLSMNQTAEVLKKWIHFQKKDSNWIEFQCYRRRLLYEPGFSLLHKTIIAYFSSIQPKYGLKGLHLKRWLIDITILTGLYKALINKTVFGYKRT